jgi:hypothetical protein
VSLLPDSAASAAILHVFGEQLKLVDPATGRPIPGYPPIAFGEEGYYLSALSPDGRTVAIAFANSTLRLVDVSAWQERDTTFPVPVPRLNALGFSPDSSTLAIIYDAYSSHVMPKLALLDVKQSILLAETTLSIWPRFGGISFTPDGRSLILYGRDRGDSDDNELIPMHVARLNLPDLQPQWSLALDDVTEGVHCPGNCHQEAGTGTIWRPAVVMAPDGRSLYVIRADADELAVVDLEAGTVEWRMIQPVHSWFQRLLAWFGPDVAHAKALNQFYKEAVISPDGRTLYVVSSELHYEVEEGKVVGWEDESLLQLVDVMTGEVIAAFDANASEIRLADDATHLFLFGWGGESRSLGTQLFALDSRDVVADLDGWRVEPGRLLNGDRVLFATQHAQNGKSILGIVDDKTFEVACQWTPERDSAWITGG